MLRDKVSVEEMEMIDYYRSDYAYSGDRPRYGRASTHEILKYWAEKKGFLYQLLGNQLIYTKDICIKAPYDMLERDMGYLLDRDNFYCWYRDLGWKLYEDDYKSRDAFFQIMRRDWLTKNRIEGETYKFKFPKDDKVIAAPHGSKPLKFLAKVAELYGKTELFEEFRLAHSRVLNKKELHGELVLSIHPLDYMTMSDNNCGWSSCMSWQEAGCYRRGTVEMMNSPIVLVAYLKAKEDMRIPGGHWSNKKWRQLIVVTEDFATGIKGYPYESKDLTSICLLTIQELAEKNLPNLKYSQTVIDYEPFNRFSVGDREFSFEFECGAMYNDFENADEFYMIMSENIVDGNHYCYYSGVANCMHCGSIGDDYGCFDDAEGNLICEDCCPNYYCAECGEHIYENDVCEVDGQYLCSYCYENHTVETKDDEELHLEGNTYRIHLVGTVDGIHYSNKTISVYRLNDSTFMNTYFNISEFKRDANSCTYYVLIDECKQDALEDLFDFYLGDEEGIAELEEYKIAYSLSSSDRWARERALRLGEPWPADPEVENAKSEAIMQALRKFIINDFMEREAIKPELSFWTLVDEVLPF